MNICVVERLENIYLVLIVYRPGAGRNDLASFWPTLLRSGVYFVLRLDTELVTRIRLYDKTWISTPPKLHIRTYAMRVIEKVIYERDVSIGCKVDIFVYLPKLTIC